VPVSRDEMVKGYEFSKDQYVQFEPQELKAMEKPARTPRTSPSSCRSRPVDPVYFDKAYYLAPDKGGAKPYALLTQALRESNRCALGRWAARGKQYIVMIRPVEDGLVMQQLLYATEVRSIKDIEIPKTDVKPAELKLAQQLIEQQATDKFDPAAYKDDVRERIEKAVAKKVEGQEITMPEAPEPTAQVIDLMEALRASLDKKKAAPSEARSRRGAEESRRRPQAAEARRSTPSLQHARPRGSSAPASMHSTASGTSRSCSRLPRSTIRSLIEAGFVSPARGPRNSWRFSFQDLIVLRTGRSARRGESSRAGGSRARCASLRRHLPESMPLSGLAISAVGDRVVVREGASRWQAESGQYLLAFEGDPANDSLEVIARGAKRSRRGARDWFEKGLALEDEDTEPRSRVRPGDRSDPELLDAHLNRGRLLHEAGRLGEAERAYTDAVTRCGADPLLLFNLGVLLEDMDRKPEAIEAYRARSRVDPDACRRPLQPRATLRDPQAAEGSDPAHGAVPAPGARRQILTQRDYLPRSSSIPTKSSACSSSIARIPSSMRFVVESLSPRYSIISR
jgi:DNA end-binding protein Ku